jgi:hypothetical protein
MRDHPIRLVPKKPQVDPAKIFGGFGGDSWGVRSPRVVWVGIIRQVRPHLHVLRQMGAETLFRICAVEGHDDVVHSRRLEKDRGDFVLQTDILKLRRRDHSVWI